MLNKYKVTEIIAEIQRVLKTIPEVQFDLSSIKYGQNQIKAKLVCTVGSKEDQLKFDQEKFAKDAQLVGLLPSHLNAEFKYNGEVYQITEINLRRYKFPISAISRKTGKSYRFDVNSVKQGLKQTIKTKRPVEDILKDLKRVALELSPENLSCDGELTKEQTDRRYRLLKEEETKFVNELGRYPTEDELK